ncbi:hypothetical protein GCM10023212_32770 [Luteolibacter yonseiensis]
MLVRLWDELGEQVRKLASLRIEIGGAGFMPIDAGGGVAGHFSGGQISNMED